MTWFWLPNNPNKPKQYRLRAFYIGAYALLTVEAAMTLVWIAQMFTFKFDTTLNILTGAPYRITNTLFLFHLGTPIALTGIVQQAMNNNSVLWWTFFAFLMGLFGDLETLLEIAKENVPRISTYPMPWRFVLAVAIINFSLSVLSILWYFIWRKWLPKASEQRRQDKPLLNNYY
jgi:hypothetical protein